MPVVLLLFAVLLAADLQAAPAHAPAHDQRHACVPRGQWLDPASGKTITNTALLQRLSRTRVVLLGEDHDNIQHHRWQLIVAAQLHARQEGLRLGFESFPRSVQAVLDRWVAGQMDEKAFLRESRWEQVWRYDPAGYLPLFRFARMYRIPMIALNVERALVSRVGAEGWASIPADEREGVGDPAPPDPEYLDLLAEMYGRHFRRHGEDHGDHGQGTDAGAADTDLAAVKNDPRFQRFVQGQLLWDRAMAEAIAGALADGAPQVVAIAGAGHLMGGYGIPHQLAALGVQDSAVLLPWDGAFPCEALEAGLADAVFGLAPPEREETADKPRLGIYLQQSEDGVRITRVNPGSVAEQAGLKRDDLILTVAGRPVKAVEDVVRAVHATAPGTWLPLTIRRGQHTQEIIARFPPKDDKQ